MYSNPLSDACAELKNRIFAAAKAAARDGAIKSGDLCDFEVAVPSEKNRGDLYSNFAMQNAKALSLAPRKIAEELVSRIDKSGLCEDIEIAGPGFVNFTLSKEWYGNVIRAALAEGENYGRSEGGCGRRVMVEFVSANPTGPMHMGNARGGVIGDTVAALLERTGCSVTREFYVNDAGNQVALFAKSLEIRMLQELHGEASAQFPENGYHGDDIKVLAKKYLAEKGAEVLSLPEEERMDVLSKYGLLNNIAAMRRDLERYRIKYDVWFFESELHESGYVAETLELLTKRGHTYEKDGALWFKASEFGCEKDEVLRKQNGFFTYYAVDIAYHRNKFEKRGFDTVINVFGADHHGHTVRFKAGMAALGIDSLRLEFVLMQLVKLLKGGEIVRMSKRTGKAVSLTDLLDEIPVDAARYFFSSRTPASPMDFDLDLAVKEDSDNPVYYVQYAHARICSIIKSLSDEGFVTENPDKIDLTLLRAPSEIELIRQIALLPLDIAGAAAAHDPARIVRYLYDTATLFHKFYSACHVRGVEAALMQARVALILATKQVIENVCEIIKIDAPDVM